MFVSSRWCWRFLIPQVVCCNNYGKILDIAYQRSDLAVTRIRKQWQPFLVKRGAVCTHSQVLKGIAAAIILNDSHVPGTLQTSSHLLIVRLSERAVSMQKHMSRQVK